LSISVKKSPEGFKPSEGCQHFEGYKPSENQKRSISKVETISYITMYLLPRSEQAIHLYNRSTYFIYLALSKIYLN